MPPSQINQIESLENENERNERSQKKNYDDSIYAIRVAFVGLCGVGKTSIIQRFVNNSFSFKYDPTVDIRQYVAFTDLNMSEKHEDELPRLAYIIIDDLYYNLMLFVLASD